MVDTTRLDENQTGYIAAMRNSIQHLEHLFNHVSTYALMEAGNFQVNLEEIFLDDFCRSIIKNNLAQNFLEQTQLSIYLTANTPISILTDRTYLSELIAFSFAKATQQFNSVKFVLKIGAHPWQTASDDLPPIAYTINNPQLLYRIVFEFTPVAPPLTDMRENNKQAFDFCGKPQTINDLLAEQICQKLGGEMINPNQKTSESGIGFAILAEISPQTYPAFMAVHPRHLTNLSVCILDHEENSRRRLTTQCESWGMTVFHSVSTPVIIAPDILIINASAAEQLPPNLTAFYEQNDPFTILIRPSTAMEFKPTANLVQEPASPTAERLYELFTLAFLHREVDRTLDSSDKELMDENLAGLKPTSMPYPLKILICEPSPIEAQVLQAQLAQTGQSSEIFKQTSEFLLEHLMKTKYDLLITQLQRPEHTELAFIQKLKKDLPTPLQPFILAITANPVRFNRKEVLSSGADAILLKPIQLADIKAILTQISEQLKANRPTRRAQGR
jgi:CheY-like chemotaxis protein